MINIQPIEKRREFDDGASLEVHSLFYTIQGEGPFSGHPAVFVRLSGCNLQCPRCDTDYTSKNETLSIDEIIDVVASLYPRTIHNKHPLVVITGGEPFRQNISELVRVLIHDGMHVQIETNGTLAPSPMLPEVGVTIVCSPKTGKVNKELQPRIDAYKYVLDHASIGEDGLPMLALDHTAKPWVARPHEGFNGPVYLQPMDPTGNKLSTTSAAQAHYEKNVAAVRDSCLRNGYIVQLQTHKLIGVE